MWHETKHILFLSTHKNNHQTPRWRAYYAHVLQPKHTHTHRKRGPGVDVWTQTSQWKADHSCTAAMSSVDQSVSRNNLKCSNLTPKNSYACSTHSQEYHIYPQREKNIVITIPQQYSCSHNLLCITLISEFIVAIWLSTSTAIIFL